MSDGKTCCPEFEPDRWDGAIHHWTQKRFIKGNVFTFFYMPLNFGTVIRKLNALVEQAQGTIPDWLCLADHTSKWNMNLYLAVDQKIPAAKNVTLSGKMVTRVYEGPYKDTSKWCADFATYCRKEGLDVKKQFMWYTTCPKCAKKYGKNYVVIMGQC